MTCIRPARMAKTLGLCLARIVVLALPCFLAAFARAPLPVAYAEWSRAHCAQAHEIVRVASTAEEWNKLWQQFGEKPPRPLRSNEKALGIFLGSRPTGGYGVSIEDVKIVGNAVRAEYYFDAPRGGEMLTQALTSPCTVVAVETGTLPLTGYRLTTR